MSLPGRASAQYRVSGIVEFTYHDLETTTGNTTTTDQYWTQHYGAQLSSFIYDPRFLQFSGGADYQILTRNKGNDNDILSYNVNAAFFPGLKFSWNLFSRNTTNTVETSANLAGYDINTTSYGGALQMRLGSKGRNGNNRNNRNNQNNNSGVSIPLPDVMLSYTSTEVESQSAINPLHETREDTKGSLAFGQNSSFSLNLDGGLEKYNNLQDGRSYDMTTANIALTSRVTSDADLSVSGLVNSRDTRNFLNFDAKEDVYSYTALLNFKEKQGWSQYYKYSFSARKASLFDYSDQNVDARVKYRLTPEWFLEGGLTSRVADYIQHATLLVPAETESSLNSGGGVAGGGYAKTYTPAFLGPFSFSTNYDFTSGRNSYSATAAGLGGRGSYYKNTAALGLISTGWVKDQMSLYYRYNSQRDRSPLDYDVREDSLSLTLSTRRIPKVAMQGTASYNVSDTKNTAGSEFLNSPVATTAVNAPGVTQERRFFNYNATIDYYLAQFLTLTGGATRGQTTTSAFTLATLPSPFRTDDFLAFGTAVFNYSITRNLSYRMDYREEYRSTIQTDTRSHQAGAYINYRLRQILVSLEYRIRQDVPENALRTEQQYYYARLSRPF